MKRRLRRFLAVGLLVTAVDVGLVSALVDAGLPWVGADIIAVLVAAMLSFAVHRQITFADDSHALVDHQAASFAAAVWPALVADVVVVGLASLVLPDTTGWLLVAKAAAVLVGAAVRLLRYRRVLFAAVRADQVPSADRSDPPGSRRVSVILPAYRAEAIVAQSVRTLREELAELGDELEIVIVDDGSGDGTAEAARLGGADLVVQLTENMGKGAAVRAGMLAASGRTRIFTDIDLAYPPEQLRRLLVEVEGGADVVVGSRRHADTHTVQGAGRFRELGSLVFNLFTHVVLLGHYRDTQSGLKGFRSDAAELIFSLTRINGFAFDVEVLHLAERYRLALVEVPALLDNVDESTISFAADTVKMVRDVFRIRRWSAQGHYDIGEARERTVDQWNE